MCTVIIEPEKPEPRVVDSKWRIRGLFRCCEQGIADVIVGFGRSEVYHCPDGITGNELDLDHV